MTHIITGVYGSGKTEFAVNLGLHLAPATIADLDVVNPFFRSREKEAYLAKHQVNIAGSSIDHHVAQDIPAVSFSFLSAIRRQENVVIDLAGGPVGLRLLASCYDDILPQAYQFLCVINPNRPETASPAQIIDFIHTINRESKLPITGLVNNGHMLAHTTAQHILDAQKMILEVSHTTSLPIAYTLVQADIHQQVKAQLASQHTITFPKAHMREAWQH